MTPRYLHGATLLNNGKVLIAGGFDNGSYVEITELYDPATGFFGSTGSLANPRNRHTATLLNNGKVLVAGGQGAIPGVNGFSVSLASSELYDPSTGIFSPSGSMSITRVDHAATLLKDGRILVTGGIGGFALTTAEVYDPATGSFGPAGTMTTPRYGHTATLLNNGKVLITGGSNGSFALNYAELYDPATGAFSFTGNLTSGRYGHKATLLNSGKVLISGGDDGNRALASAELYDPVAGTVSATGAMTTTREAHTATLLSTGNVLITGGTVNSVNGPGSVFSSAELYDPGTGAFSPIGSMTTARYGHAATLLNNGKALITGGSDSPYPSPNRAELYLPATQTPAGLVSISLTPVNPSISTSQAQQFIATGAFSDNSTQALASVTWTSSNTSVATITNDGSNHGVAFGSGAGTTTITATAGNVSGSTTLTVTF